MVDCDCGTACTRRRLPGCDPAHVHTGAGRDASSAMFLLSVLCIPRPTGDVLEGRTSITTASSKCALWGRINPELKLRFVLT